MPKTERTTDSLSKLAQGLEPFGSTDHDYEVSNRLSVQGELFFNAALAALADVETVASDLIRMREEGICGMSYEAMAAARRLLGEE